MNSEDLGVHVSLMIWMIGFAGALLWIVYVFAGWRGEACLLLGVLLGALSLGDK